MDIREVRISDAGELLALMKTVEMSNFMLFGPGERKTSEESFQKHLSKIQEDTHSQIFVAENPGGLIGYMFVLGNSTLRNRHSSYIVIGVKESERGAGIGKALFNKADQWAEMNQIHRLELTVLAHNKRALSLYQKMGFEIEGTKRHSLFIDGEFKDEYYMSKLRN
ncbi:GNAT family N-acetyltransferase [Peribacillus alkalitolerans]|uniref:GNAT family N-acetyltransferase n=1 Tax=Peribacillus alkalitolerans TaxID=1550385 RepID=UPI0013D1D8CD|nr:GNAT family N-acetyltransferase [Peribacillus alkalitolerans]